MIDWLVFMAILIALCAMGWPLYLPHERRYDPDLGPLDFIIRILALPAVGFFILIIRLADWVDEILYRNRT